MLDSALARPRNHAAHGAPGLAELGALHALAIARNHPFVDGDKRHSSVARETFLALNGMELTASDADATITMLEVEAGTITNAAFIAWVVASAAEKRGAGR